MSGEENYLKERRYNSVTKDEFNDLKTTVNELKIALIGIDGKNGLRGTLQSLDNRVHEMEKTVGKISNFMNTFKSKDLMYHETFSTKIELLNLKQSIIDEITKMYKKQDEIRDLEKERRDNREVDQKSLDLKRKDLFFVKVAIGLSILGVTISTVLSLINFFSTSGCAG